MLHQCFYFLLYALSCSGCTTVSTPEVWTTFSFVTIFPQLGMLKDIEGVELHCCTRCILSEKLHFPQDIAAHFQ